jgi:hypothetical protein
VTPRRRIQENGSEPGDDADLPARKVEDSVHYQRWISAAGAAREVTMGDSVAPNVVEYLSSLSKADANLAATWRPDDQDYLADLHRQTLMNLSWAYFAHFYADAEHPDLAPLWNSAYTCQPNPDDVYLFTPIRGDLRYRVSGNRGTCRKLIFSTQRGMTGLVDSIADMSGFTMLDLGGEVPLGSDFEIVFSAERPPGYDGLWHQIAPDADILYVRFRMVDWEAERDPQISIECLDKVPAKPRLTRDQILERLELAARTPGRMTDVYFEMQNGFKNHVGFNVFDPIRYDGIGARQVYLPAAFEFSDGEALIIETEMPKVRPYWNFQVNDPIFNAVEYVYRFASLNEWDSYISPDGRIRIIVANEDPGTPNWLDAGGFTEGTVYGRWYDCDIEPTPTITRVPFAELRDHLPPDTPVVTPEERADLLRRRVQAAQRRRRW